MNGKELIKILKKNGWIVDRISGSHNIMIKEGERSIPIPVHGKKDLPKGLVSAILKQANIQ
ncbi:type II toxin-antitoxin system HicA family toxin [candidate division CSSED10-310 bacterium]|uniref:Type II toxin-antitoxin system HicA family toxin n=1 Tax=candidate division CSSED10-310 bacterium TaxID=2855610 RepID=A0ABV6Z557_UNCC1